MSQSRGAARAIPRLAFRRSFFLLGLLAAVAGWASPACGVDDPADFYPERYIAPFPAGALGRPFGESVVVQGKVIEGPYKNEDSTTTGRLLVQRINGVATQQGMTIRFDSITPREWWTELGHPQGEELWKVQGKKLAAMKGKTFEMRGYEYGEHAGMTAEEFLLVPPVQTTGFRFALKFRPLMKKAIPEIRFAPADFVNRLAEFEGRAETREGAGCMVGADGWVLRVRDGAWPADFEKREISAKGRVVKTPGGGWQLEGADLRLLRLSDQVGKEVKLDGVAWSLNGVWWFEYRDEKLYIEKQADLPGWEGTFHGQVMTMNGVLERAKLPDLDQISLKQDRDLREYYIVRRASWSAFDAAWKKSPEIPQAPPLTIEYLKSCGIKVDDDLQKKLKNLSK